MQIPMSSLKVPVNLEYSTHDSYIVDGAEPFYLKSVLSIPGQEDEIRK